MLANQKWFQIEEGCIELRTLVPNRRAGTSTACPRTFLNALSRLGASQLGP